MLALWRQRPLLVSAFLLACAVTLFFAVRFVSQAIYWSDPAHQNQRVEGWMTVGYIARSWQVDPHQLDDLAGLPQPQEKGHPQPLVEIARDRGVPVTEVIAEVEAALTTLREKEPQE